MSDVLTEDINKTEIGTPDAGEATQMVISPQAEATQMGASVECPVCHTANAPGETWCMDCGFLLGSEPVAIGEMPEIQAEVKLVTADGTREFALKPGANVVGRENADVLLAHNTVSRKHAVVTVEENGVFVEDCGSTNGTSVDGHKIEPGERVQVKNGTEVVFGNSALKFDFPDAECAEKEAEALKSDAEEEEIEQDQPITEVEAGGEPVEPKPEPVARLVSKDGSLSFAIKPGVNTIGRRDGANDIVIPDPYCSGRHADLTAEDERLILTDLGSTNGTLVNGVKLEHNAPKELNPGDEITFGQVAFTIA